MTCTNCENSQIKYAGNGSLTLFTFPFTYLDDDDVIVELYDYDTGRWVEAEDDDWSFANATTIEFTEAPTTPDDPVKEPFNIKISRCTDIDTLEATFYPGSAIRAQDLNDNFEQLQLAIEEGRCHVPDWLYDYLDANYWSKGDTIFSDDEFVCDDEHLASSGAICKKVDEEIDNLKGELADLKITAHDQITARAESMIDEEHYFTSAASKARYDVYTQDPTPGAVPYQQPGKEWFDTDTLRTYIWDPNSKSWVDVGDAGPAGPGELEEAPDDGQIYGRQNKSWVPVTSGGGGGGTSYSFVKPLVDTNGSVSINLTTLNFVI
jgi:hypothetical protein